MKQRRQRRSHKLRALLIAVLAIALLIVVLNWVVMPLVVGRGREATVPGVVGLDRPAVQRLEVDQRGMVVLGPAGPDHFVRPLAHLLLRRRARRRRG